MKPSYITVAVIILTCALCGACCAWEYFYDASTLPNDPSLGADEWRTFSGSDVSMCTTDGDILHVVDARTDKSAYFYRYSAPPLSPITMEARVRVASGWGTTVDVGTPSFRTLVSLYPDHVEASFSYGGWATYSADMTAYHTIRVATDSQGRSYVWLDGAEIAQGVTTVGNQGAVSFGGFSVAGLSESYWDYVAYSAAFLPIPEPFSLLTLACGLAGVGWAARSRR